MCHHLILYYFVILFGFIMDMKYFLVVSQSETESTQLSSDVFF